MNRQSQLVVFLFLFFPYTCPGQSFEWYDRIEPADGFDAFTSEVVASEYGIYSVAHFDCEWQHCATARLSKYRAEDGKLLWRRKFSYGQLGTTPMSLTVTTQGVYVTGWFDINPSVDAYASFVRGFAHDGDLILTLDDLYPNVFARAIESDSSGLYVLGSTPYEIQNPSTAVLQHLDFDGQILWTRVLPSGQAIGLAAGDGLLFAASDAWIYIYRTNGSFVRRFLHQMGGLLGQMAYHDGFLYTSSGLTLDKFDLEGVPVWSIPVGAGANGMWDSFALAASDDGLHQIGRLIRANTGPTMGIILLHVGFDGSILASEEYPGARYFPTSLSVMAGAVYSGGTDDFQGAYDADFQGAYTARHSGDDLAPPSLLSLTGATSAQPPRLAVLQHDYGAGPVRAAIRDAAPGSFEDLVLFSEHLTPVSFDKVADLDGNGYEELVVVSRLPALAEVRDSVDGTLLSKIWIGSGLEPLAAVVEERPGEEPRLAVAARGRDADRVLVRVYDLVTGSLLTSISYNPNFEPVDILALPPAAAGTEHSYALLGRSPIVGSPHKVEIRGTTSGLIGNHWIETGKSPLQLELAGTAANPRLAVLLADMDVHRPKIRQVGLQTALDTTIRFSDEFSPVVMAVLPDTNGNGQPQITISSIKDDGKVKAETRDANSGQLDHRITLDSTFRPRDAAFVGAVPGFTDSAFGLLNMRDSDSVLRAWIVDAESGEMLFELDFGL